MKKALLDSLFYLREINFRDINRGVQLKNLFLYDNDNHYQLKCQIKPLKNKHRLNEKA
ncbi:hypothetical protein MTP04_01280 [Lysinibacillus sp. PLM2]|nr:hypothetical protein MTP04_01280 [Lysinibacillus sp. PLM2]